MIPTITHSTCRAIKESGSDGRNLPYRIDITEIDGFDDLHHAEGILKEAQERAAEVYHADETHFLVNGSTVGILSAILGTTEKGIPYLWQEIVTSLCIMRYI